MKADFETIQKLFPDLKYPVELEQIRKTAEYKLGLATGRVPSTSQLHTIDTRQIADLMHCWVHGFIWRLEQAGIPMTRVQWTGVAWAYFRFLIGWVDAGRKYGGSSTIDQIIAEIAKKIATK